MRSVGIPIAICAVLLLSGCHHRKSSAQANNRTSSSDQALTASVDPAKAKQYLEEGKAAYEKDEDEKAAKAFEQAVKLDPEFAEAYFRLALTYDALGDKHGSEDAYKKAIERYKRQLKTENKDAEAYYNLGRCYKGLHLYSEAVAEYRQATHLKSDDADIYYDLGMALTRLAQYDEAVAAFQKCLDIDPENFRAQDALEEAREGVKRVKAGRKYAEDQLKKQQEDEKKKQGNSNTPQSSGYK